MSDDKAFSIPMPAPTEIPGMQIVYQQPTGPDGRGISFQIAEDRSIDKQSLVELLGRVYYGARWLSAMQDLPDCKMLLRKNLKLLEQERRNKAETDARINAGIAARSINRREMKMALPTDVNALKAHDDRIAMIQEQIMLAEIRIPYLEAILRGEDPDPATAVPDTEPHLLAAE